MKQKNNHKMNYIFVSSWVGLMTSVAPTQLKLKYSNNLITFPSP